MGSVTNQLTIVGVVAKTIFGSKGEKLNKKCSIAATNLIILLQD
jgi:hypothetical protein